MVRLEANTIFLLLDPVVSFDMRVSEAREIFDHEVLYGPTPLPGNGEGNLTSPQRREIRDSTMCSAAVRQRAGWARRKLTIKGPNSNLMMAIEMAHGYILESQQKLEALDADTPGNASDILVTKQTAQTPIPKAVQRKRKRDNRKRRELVAARASNYSFLPFVRSGYGYHCNVHVLLLCYLSLFFACTYTRVYTQCMGHVRQQT